MVADRTKLAVTFNLRPLLGRHTAPGPEIPSAYSFFSRMERLASRRQMLYLPLGSLET